MNKIISIVALLMFSVSSYGCDEECRKQAAAKKHNVKFPSYLTEKYCAGIKDEFLSSTMRSLQRYRDTKLNDQQKYGMKNTRNFIDQRSDWLKECDDYLRLSEGKRLFAEDKTTGKIFAAMTSVSSELTSLVNGASYAVEEGSNSIVGEKFDRLFKLVDDHKTLMQLKGQFVTR